jgi:heme-degrading monooxygenase HmoA
LIRVLISRHIREGCLDDYISSTRNARKTVLSFDGFIAGELLEEKNNPNHAIIISCWESFKHWDKWYGSEERKALNQEMLQFLEKEEEITLMEACQLTK